MSKVTNQHNEENYVSNDYNLAKLFIWGNRYSQATFKNNTGAAAAFSQGVILGRDSSDNTIVPLDSANAANGEAIPVGVLAQDLAEIPDGGTLASVNFSNKGDLNEDLVIFQGAGDDKETVIASGGNRSIEDLLVDIGLRLIATDSLTGPDNS